MGGAQGSSTPYSQQLFHAAQAPQAFPKYPGGLAAEAELSSFEPVRVGGEGDLKALLGQAVRNAIGEELRDCSFDLLDTILRIGVRLEKV